MPRLTFSAQARLDLREIGDYIRQDNPRRARDFVEELRTHCLRIAENPGLYVRRENIGRGARMAIHGRYLILFRSDANRVQIMRIVHAARRIPRLD